MRWNEQKTSKNTSDIIDCNLKEIHQILIFLVRIFPTHLAIKWPFNFPPTQRLLLHYTRKLEEVKYALKWTKKSIDFIYPDLLPSTALTLVQSIARFVCRAAVSLQTPFRVVMNLRSDWFGAKHHRRCYQWMEKASACLCSKKSRYFEHLLTTRRLDKLSAKWQKFGQN